MHDPILTFSAGKQSYRLLHEISAGYIIFTNNYRGPIGLNGQGPRSQGSKWAGIADPWGLNGLGPRSQGFKRAGTAVPEV